MTDKHWYGGDVEIGEVLAEAKRLSVEFPNRIGSSETMGCVYTEYDVTASGDLYDHPVKPVCVVGTAIFNITGKYVAPDFEGTRIGTDKWVNALGVRDLDGHRAWRELLDAQIKQDSRAPWGKLFD